MQTATAYARHWLRSAFRSGGDRQSVFSHNTSPTSNAQNRIAIDLKTLIDLAKPAAMLDLKHVRIEAAQSGQYLSHCKGRGMAFDETRLYQPGDDVRRIDWRVTARTGKPHSKVFKEERERPLFVAVDYRPSMQFATRGVFKAVQAAKLAALLAWAAQQNGDRIGGQIFGSAGFQELKPQTGKPALLRFLNALVSPQWHGGTSQSLEQALARLQHHARPGSLIYILSDFRGLDDNAERWLSKLARHCELMLVQIYDPLESQLPDKGRYRFTDGQRDTIVDTSDQNRLVSHQQRFQARQWQLQSLCRKLRMQYLTCSTMQLPQELFR